MSERTFKVGAKVLAVHRSIGREDDDFYGVSQQLTIQDVHPEEECAYYLCGGEYCAWYTRDIVFSTRKEALAEAIHQNEALASDLTLEIGRLKDELEKEDSE